MDVFEEFGLISADLSTGYININKNAAKADLSKSELLKKIVGRT